MSRIVAMMSLTPNSTKIESIIRKTLDAITPPIRKSDLNVLAKSFFLTLLLPYISFDIYLNALLSFEKDY